MRTLIALVVVLALAATGIFILAGRLEGPAIDMPNPAKFVGVSAPLDVVIESPGGEISALRVVFEQEGRETQIVALEEEGSARHVTRDGDHRLRVTHTVGRDNVPGLRTGPGRIVVTASRPVLYGLRQIETRLVRDVSVRLERPTVSVVSTHHYINQGGAEAVVYRVSPADVQSGVLVGDLEYPGYPASGVTVPGVTMTDPALRVAFFALLPDQPVDVPMQLYARDEAGNAARAGFDFRTFPKPAKQSRIQLDDRFLDRVVPAILAGAPDIKPGATNLESFLAINGDLRRRNADTIASFASRTAPELLWRGEVFHPFTNSAVESAFADRRTYFYQGREVDRQVHLGFDLASYATTPIVAANRGIVLFAGELGIYGNCVIIDHGFGVQSLYAHLSSIGVQPGATVEKAQQLGLSGITGLAGGDHLHFTMLVAGRMVNPVEWWDVHWIEDRVLRKLRAAP